MCAVDVVAPVWRTTPDESGLAVTSRTILTGCGLKTMRRMPLRHQTQRGGDAASNPSGVAVSVMTPSRTVFSVWVRRQDGFACTNQRRRPGPLCGWRRLSGNTEVSVRGGKSETAKVTNLGRSTRDAYGFLGRAPQDRRRGGVVHRPCRVCRAQALIVPTQEHGARWKRHIPQGMG